MREGAGRGGPGPGCPAWAHGAWPPLTLPSALVAPWTALLATGHALSLSPCCLLGHPLFLGLGCAGRAHVAGASRLGCRVPPKKPRAVRSGRWGGQGHDLHQAGRWGALLGRRWDLWLMLASLLPQTKMCVCLSARCPERRSAAAWASSPSSSPWAATVSSSSSPHRTVRDPSVLAALGQRAGSQAS